MIGGAASKTEPRQPLQHLKPKVPSAGSTRLPPKGWPRLEEKVRRDRGAASKTEPRQPLQHLKPQFQAPAEPVCPPKGWPREGEEVRRDGGRGIQDGAAEPRQPLQHLKPVPSASGARLPAERLAEGRRRSQT